MNLHIHLLVQSFHRFSWNTNLAAALITLVIFAGLVGFIIFLNVSRAVQSSKIMRSGTLDVSETPLTKVSPEFLRVTREYGLSRPETAFLEKLFNDAGLKPSEAFRDRSQMAENFAAAYRTMKRDGSSPEEDLKNTARFFSIRNAVEYKNMFIETARSGRNMIPRKHKRKESEVPCAYYFISVQEIKQGIKKTQKLTIEGTKNPGTLLDVSAGGCAVSISNAPNTGRKIKIEFKAGRHQIAALGVILRVNKNAQKTVMHIQFLKIPPNALMSLNAYIYGYNE